MYVHVYHILARSRKLIDESYCFYNIHMLDVQTHSCSEVFGIIVFFSLFWSHQHFPLPRWMTEWLRSPISDVIMFMSHDAFSIIKWNYPKNFHSNRQLLCHLGVTLCCIWRSLSFLGSLLLQLPLGLFAGELPASRRPHWPPFSGSDFSWFFRGPFTLTHSDGERNRNCDWILSRLVPGMLLRDYLL